MQARESFITTKYSYKNVVDTPVNESDSSEEFVTSETIVINLNELNEDPNADDFLEEFDGPGWMKLVTAAHPWDEKRRPFVSPLDYDDVKNDFLKLEMDGYLTHMIVATGISNLDLIPGTVSYGLTKLQLPGKNLRNIEILATYQLLQYVDLSYNMIEDTTSLSKIVYLIVLDLSHNKISKFVLNPSPWFLSYLNLSSNNFTTMPDLTSFWSLKHLNMSYNCITEIEGIYGLRFLRYLNLSHNNIKTVKNLTNVSLINLILSHNKISEWESVPESSPSTMYTLRYLNVSHNNLTTLKVFEHAYNLQVLNIAFNRICSIKEFDYMINLKSMHKLWINGNKLVQSFDDFRNLCVFCMPRLKLLNNKEVSGDEKIGSIFTYDYNIMTTEVRKYWSRTLINNCISPPPFGQEIVFLPTRSTIVMLVGTVGSYHSKLALMIAKNYPTYIKLCRFHTTLPPTHDLRGDKNNTEEFIHVSVKEFHLLAKRGDFMLITIQHGYKYGITLTELQDDGRICLCASGLVGGLNLAWTGLNITLILVSTRDTSLFVQRVKAFHKNLWLLTNKVQKADEAEERSSLSSDIMNESENFIGEEISEEETVNEYDKKLLHLARPACTGYSNRSLLQHEQTIGSETGQAVNFEGEEDKLQTSSSLEKKFNLRIPQFSNPKITENSISTSKDNSDYDNSEAEIDEMDLTMDFLGYGHKKEEYYLNEKNFIQVMLVAREKYEFHHRNFPGCFLLGVASDDVDIAYKKIIQVIIKIYNNKDSKSEDVNTINKDSVAYKEIVKANINELMETILNKTNQLTPP